MSLLMTGFKELNYGELLAVNGGCSGTVVVRSGSCVGTTTTKTTVAPTFTTTTYTSRSSTCSGTTSLRTSSSLSCTGSTPFMLNAVNQNQKMLSIIEAYSKKAYTFGSWDCDLFVETTLKEYGVDIQKVWGSAISTDVQGHVNNLAGKTTSTPTAGWSVVMMTQSDKYSINHCGLAYIGSDGSVSFYNNTKSAGHVILEKYTSVSAFQRDFAYNKFDYYKVN